MARDYILRIIEQLGLIVASILAARRRGDVPTALAQVHEQCLQHVGLPFDLLKHASPEQVAEWLRSGGALVHPRSVILAELLLQDAEIQEESLNALGALISYLHTVCLLEEHAAAFSRDEESALRSKAAAARARVHLLVSEMGPGVADALPERFAQIIASVVARPEPPAEPA